MTQNTLGYHYAPLTAILGQWGLTFPPKNGGLHLHPQNRGKGLIFHFNAHVKVIF